MQKYAEISLDKKQEILQEYQPGVRGKGFKALAKQYKIKSGHKTIRNWYQKWDGTKESLEKESGGDRRSILSEKEKKTLIVGFIRKRARTDAANYRGVQENIESKSGKKLAGRCPKTWKRTRSSVKENETQDSHRRYVIAIVLFLF